MVMQPEQQRPKPASAANIFASRILNGFLQNVKAKLQNIYLNR